ncbi:hypothetical protein N7533_011571 [Penicillium manginii]|uniref:uncharacterized protein n=1 Tax=Penicillium manginii TaxID=203109 RepID=UPI002547E9FE|nr:uncharacterized protein N7533_011571 [Penicillium manginii]KAJ5742162.1 hypothetical protein N7533_011571 [Penicillium manginii]
MDKRKLSDDPSEGQTLPSPKRRILGPSLPPPTENTPADSASNSDAASGSDSDDSDDDFGPSLPPPAGQSMAPTAIPASSAHSNTPDKEQKPETQRDDWMLHPPENSDWASKIDPTQLRNRKFQTGKSARSATAGSKGLDAAWVETPEEKLRRLEDQVMGVGAPSSGPTQSLAGNFNAAKDKEMEEKIKKYNDRAAKKTRLEKSESKRKEEEDDPSTRAFDREKDMAVSSKISNSQRREMVSKASDYSSRFSKGSFL